ncbi:hypothetical protein V2J09_010866 [Rumex salicifolius]
MDGIVVVFDFDKTIIDIDSDNWVVDELGFTDLFNQLLPTMPWNSLMDRMMREMHERGVSISDIVGVLQRVPIHPRIIPAIKSAHAAGCDLRVVSDANEFFIETILQHLGVRSYFSEINTNPGHVDEQGRLRIGPHHDFTVSPHGCGLCPPNMCKGHVMERMLSELQGCRKIFIYLGDGSGDYCPAIKLRSGDFVMPRKDFPAYHLIASNPHLIKAEVNEWDDGAELESVLLGLLANISAAAAAAAAAASTQLYADCKFETIHPTEPLFKALPVPH